MGRSPVLLALVVVLASAGAGLVDADVTPGGSFDAASPAFVPRAGAGTGLFGGAPAAPPEPATTAGDRTGGSTRATGADRSTSPALDPADGPRDGDDPVRIGVIGSAFGRDPAALEGRVAARYRAGAPRFGPVAGEHGTAVASVVARRADGASLYLASVGYEPTPATYDRAVGWLVSEGVDVIVDAGSYYPRTAEGTEELAVAAERAADAGVVFVTSGGNTVRRHWRGTAADEGWIAFADGTEGNRLGDGSVAGRVTLRLYWEGAADYDLYLYRDTPGADDPVVAKSTRGDGHAEAIDASLPRGHYYVGVYARDPGAAPLDLFAARHRLEYAGANGSAVALATAEGVISVGAVDSRGRLAAYSPADTDVRAAGRVRLDDGTLLEGTSAAAPAVAGVVATMEARSDGEGLSPAEVERLLRTTARDGRIDADAAIAAAASARMADGAGSTANDSAADRDRTRTARGP